MTFMSISIKESIPPEGEFEIVHEGKHYAVVRHPRNNGWMAMAPPKDWRDAGMKAHDKREGAIRWIKARLPAIPPAHRGDQAT
jgi:hypothetical protein